MIWPWLESRNVVVISLDIQINKRTTVSHKSSLSDRGASIYKRVSK